MNGLTFLLISVATAGLPVDVARLEGPAVQGELTAVSSAAVSLTVDGKTESLPLKNILEVRFKANDENTALPEQPAAVLQTVDGAVVSLKTVAVTAQTLSGEAPNLGQFQLPLTAVNAVRLTTAAPDLEAAWNKLIPRERSQDWLVLKKGNVLDHLDGVVGTIDEKEVKFLLDGDEIPVQREKVFGVIYYRRDPASSQAVCVARFGGGDTVPLKSIQGTGEQLTGVHASGATMNLATARLRSLDFSQGKVAYLSDLEPLDVKYTPYFESIVWPYRRDRSLDGGKLRVGDHAYERGLAIHSRTELVFRAGRSYRKFRAVMGIDRSVLDTGNLEPGDVVVGVVIRGDDRVLFEGEVKGSDPPRELDLDVTGVRDLKILVDYAGMDIADHLDLADARFLK